MARNRLVAGNLRICQRRRTAVLEQGPEFDIRTIRRVVQSVVLNLRVVRHKRSFGFNDIEEAVIGGYGKGVLVNLRAV